MAIHIDLEGVHLDSIMTIVRQMRQDGYVQGKDFDFAYYPPKMTLFSHEDAIRHTVFTFYDEQLAMLFKLKHG